MSQFPRIEHSVTGRLVADPAVRTSTASQEQFLTFRLAENTRRLNQQTQEWEDGETTFYDVTIPASRERLAANVQQSLSKGDLVTVRGDYQARAFVNRENEAQLGHYLWAKDVAASLGQHPVGIDRVPDQAASFSSQELSGSRASAEPAAYQRPAHVDPHVAVLPQPAVQGPSL